MPRFLRFAAPAVALASAVAIALVGAPASAQTTEQKLSFPAAGTQDGDAGAVTLGVKFTAAKPGKVVAVEFHRASTANTARAVQMWSPTGQLLGTAQTPNATTTGFNRATFATPVTVPAGQTFVASYLAPKGRYTARNGGFAQPRTDGDLTAPVSAGVYRYGATAAFPNQSFQSSDYYVTPVFLADVTAPTTTTTPPPTETSTPPPTTTPPPPQAGWPDESNTGVPADTALTDYTGPCTITAANTVIDAKKVNCSLEVRAPGVQITRSQITGAVSTPDDKASTAGFTLTDSEVSYPTLPTGGMTMIGAVNFTVLRSDIRGGNRGVYCRYKCTVKDSYVTGTLTNSVTHASGVRMSQFSTIEHNTLWCSANDVPPDGGCSADLTGYGDFEPVHDNLIKNNLFHTTPGGACAYGGSSGDDGAKPYGNQASNIVFQDNVFQRGSGGKCGFYFPITDFDSSRPGNQWINNTWEDGTPLPPAN